MKRIVKFIIFFIGWLLSPFTWWNDPFINMPLSYLAANLLFYLTRLPFKWLVVGSYILSNLLGMYFMYAGGKGFVLSSRDRAKAAVSLIIFIILYSVVMIYLANRGKIVPF